MTTPSNVYELLERDEGRKRSAYKDHLGFWTIGVGRLIDARKGGGLSEQEIDILLRNDVEGRVVDLTERLEWYPYLDEVRRAVLLSMSFQMGVDGLLEFKRTLDAVHSGQYQDAARFMMESLWAKQTPERAERLSEMMKDGEWR